MEKVLYCFYKIILKIRENLKCHNRVYILSSEHTYRPMRARVVAQLFYKDTMVVYHLPKKSGIFGWSVNGKIDFVSPNGNFLGKTGFLER